MVVGERHRILHRAGPLCRECYGNYERESTDSVLASRPARAVLHQSHTGYSLYARRDVVEVLTKCRVQYLERAEVRFVGAEGAQQLGLRRVRQKPGKWPSGKTRRKLAIENTGGFPHVHCAFNRSRDNGSACFSPRAHHPSGRASFEADARRQAASIAAIQAETSSASLMAFPQHALASTNVWPKVLGRGGVPGAIHRRA